MWYPEILLKMKVQHTTEVPIKSKASVTHFHLFAFPFYAESQIVSPKSNFYVCDNCTSSIPAINWCDLVDGSIDNLSKFTRWRYYVSITETSKVSFADIYKLECGGDQCCLIIKVNKHD